MAKVPASPTRVYLDQYDLSGLLNSTSLDVTQETIPVNAFSDVGPRRLVGNYDHKQSHKGLLDAVALGYDAQAFALLVDGDHYLTQLFGANAAGNVAYDSIVQLSAEPRSAAVGGAVLLDLETQGSGGLARGLVLANKITTGAENLAGYNMGATGAGTVLAAIFRVLAFAGTNITMHIEHGAADPPTVDVTGLTTTAMTAIGVQRVAVTVATNAWKRLVIAGTFTSVTILVTCGIVQGTYVAP